MVLLSLKTVASLKHVWVHRTRPSACLVRYSLAFVSLGLLLSWAVSATVIRNHIEVLVAARDAICAGEWWHIAKIILLKVYKRYIKGIQKVHALSF